MTKESYEKRLNEKIRKNPRGDEDIIRRIYTVYEKVKTNITDV